MKKCLFIMCIIIILWTVFSIKCGMVQASPFIVCDPQATVTHYRITGDPFWITTVIAQSDGSIKTDIGNIPPGTHNINVSACRTGDGWPEVCSATAPFAFTRPGGLVAPAVLKLVP
jgi:hypothetical protein